MKRKMRTALVAVIVVLVIAALAAGLLWFLSRSNSTPVNVFHFSNIGMTEYWGDNRESYGLVHTDTVQTVYLSESQTVLEILVQPGDTVKKGDILLTFDTTLSDLSMERERLKVEKLKLQLQDAKDQLTVINSLRPMVVPTVPEGENKPDLGTPLSGRFQISTDEAYDGSETDKALICWLSGDVSLTDDILEELRQTAEEYQNENLNKKDESAEETDDVPQPTVPEETEPIVVEEFHVVFRVTEGNMSKGNILAWHGVTVIRDPETKVFSFRFFDADILPDHILPEDESGDEPEIDFGSGFTAAQIAQMRQEQEKKIRQLELDVKMAEAAYKIMEKEVSDGNIYAEVDGTVVSLLSEEEAFMSQQPIIKVSGGGGFTVDGTISELELDTVYPGMEVTVTDWYTGMTYTGTVQKIGDYPSAGDGWNGMGNPTATYYPFTVFVAESADLQSGSYVSIVYSAGGSQSGVYLENPFLRTENGKAYVMVMGEDGKLEKRYVVTGKTLWGSYTQILSGITPEDHLAFPYGKNVRPGADTVISDLSVLYE